MGVGKKAEAVATVVAAVDQARVREPREPRHVEESYAQQTTLEYGYKEHISATKVARDFPSGPAGEPQRSSARGVVSFRGLGTEPAPASLLGQR